MGQRNLFNKITKLAKHLKYNGSPLKCNDIIDWKIFRDDCREKVVDLHNDAKNCI